MAKANSETVVELKTMHRIRGAVKASLTKLESTLQDAGTLFTADLLSAYEIQLHSIVQRFEDIQQKIYSCPEVTDEDFEQECHEESTFNDRVLHVQAKISQLNRTVRRDEQPSVTTTAATEDLARLWKQQLEINTKLVESMKTRNSNVKLPPIEIKKFTGNYSDWASFRDMYTCTIHTNDALSPVEKFKYLKSYLSGEAESVIDELAITDENYAVAWRTVKDRFEKKQNIVSAHIQSFLNLPDIGEASTRSLRGMFNVSHKVIQALDALNCNQRDIWLVHLLVNKMDKESVTLWSRETSSSEVASLDQFFNFLEKRCDSLEMVQSQSSGKSFNKSTEKSTKNMMKQKSSLAITQAKKCAICQQEAHQVFQCTEFINSNPTQRLELLRKSKLCINCIRGTHSVEACQSSNCRRCNMRHNTLLHEAFQTSQSQSGDTAAPSPSSASDNIRSNGTIPKADGNTAIPQPQTTAVTQSATVSTTLMSRPATTRQSVLPTVSLFLIDNNGKRYKCRALLDSCSQANLITKRLVEKCRIPTYMKPTHSISGIGSQSTRVTQAVMATINSRNHTFATKGEFLLMEKITDDQPVSDLNIEWKIPNDVFLADPDFSKPGQIDMLLGVDIFTKVIRAGKVEGNPTLLETALGYVVAGSFISGGDMLDCSCLCSTQAADTLHHAIEEFWMTEEPSSIKSSPESEEGECEKHFAHHVTRYVSGRYIVKLPTKGNVTQLGESRDSALKRFHCIERRLQKDPAIREQYTAFMKEYEDLRHMRKLPEQYESDKPAVYLPHHPVIKLSSSSTTPKELANNNLWWTGPDLSKILDNKPDVFIDSSDERLEQRKTCAVSLWQHLPNVAASENFWTILERFSSHSKMLRCLTYWRRYFQNLKAKVNSSPLDFSALKVEEIQETNHHIIRVIQKQSFPREHKALQEEQQVPKQSRVAKLNPFLDDSQIIRVGGRIQASDLTAGQKHPILLPPKHHLTKLISDKTHLQTSHGGPHMILSTMRQIYWPLRGLDVAKTTVRQCIRCFRCKPKSAHQIMGNLPPARVQLSRPFQRVGIDFCGPFQIKLPLRGGRSTKMYVCVFICFISRAIHLELVSELSTEAFLASFKRFIARRGRPTDVFCDNGKNFVGAASHINDIQQFLAEKTTKHIITKNAADDNIKFHFIPPRSPHFGGLWESAVKAFKRHFYRVVGNERLSQEAFTTVLAEVEMCLNSRPLMAQSDDPSDLEVITPGHFLIGQSLNTLPAHDVSNVPQNRLSVWRQLDQIKQHFWSRWSREILTNMQVRSKWQQPQENVNIGDLVLLIEDNLPPLAWVIGRITETHPGKDGKTRVVSIRTASGNYRRAITKIALFPKENTPEVDTSASGNMS